MATSLTAIHEFQPFLQKLWTESAFERPTPIQTQSISYILNGQDVIAQAPTGTGKTLAYLLPILEKIDQTKQNTQAVILASSHELVMQIFHELQKWTKEVDIKVASLIGGANVKRQIEKLKKSPQVVVGTPGRLHELIQKKKLKMHEVKTIVLDEGDQLLVTEHVRTVQGIIKATLTDRQVLLFSATLPTETVKRAQELMKEPKVIQVKEQATVSKSVDHIYFVCEAREKPQILEKFMRTNPEKVLAFSKDIAEINVLASKLNFKEISLGVLHSEVDKQDREIAIKQFRAGNTSLLLATDVAARGLDIKELSHVVHLEVTEDINLYVHRSGRTGRLGSEGGTVVSIVTQREERELKKFARELDVQLHQKTFYKGGIVDTKE